VVKRRDALPPSLPPRGLSQSEAAAYIGVSTSLFDKLVADGRMPAAKQINSRKVWDRLSLDEAFDALPDHDGPGSLLPADQPSRGIAKKGANSPSPDEIDALAEEGRAAIAEIVANGGRVVLAQGALWSMEEYAKYVVTRPLGKREIEMLRKLADFYGDGPLDRAFQAGGPGTMEKLEARGFVTAIERRPTHMPDYCLTDAGREAARTLPKE
jgi:hypothetical protein